MTAIAKLIDCAVRQFKIKDNEEETNQLLGIYYRLYRADRNNAYAQQFARYFFISSEFVGFITPTLLYNLCNKFNGPSQIQISIQIKQVGHVLGP